MCANYFRFAAPILLWRLPTSNLEPRVQIFERSMFLADKTIATFIPPNPPPQRLRFAIGVGDYAFSSIWFIQQQKEDLDLGVGRLGGFLKVSLHGSGVSQYALTSEYAAKLVPSGRPADGRSFVRWRRPLPSAPPSKEVSAILFPFDLRLNPAQLIAKKPNKPVQVIPPAPIGSAVRLTIVESSVDPRAWLSSTIGRWSTLGIWSVKDNRHFCAMYRSEVFDEESLAMVREGQGTPSFFEPQNLPNVGETLAGRSAHVFNNPTPTEPLQIVEVHGIAVQRTK